MPAYLVHGFRWPRQLIRIHIILHHLDDATANWLVSPTTMRVMLEDFIESFPDQMKHLPNLRFIEQYDTSDYTNKSEEFAYVANVVHEVKLSVDVQQLINETQPTEREQQALIELKTSLQVPAEVGLGWYFVVCSDLVREVPLPSPSANGSTANFLDTEYTGRSPFRRKRTLTGKSRDNDSETRASLGSRSNDTSRTLSLGGRKSEAAETQNSFFGRSASRDRRPQTSANTKSLQTNFSSASSPIIGQGAVGRNSDDTPTNGNVTPREGRKLRSAFSRFFNPNGQ